MGSALAASQQRWNNGYSPFTEMEDNTPSPKVQEACTNKSGKLNPDDCVGACFISHRPTPKRAFLLPLPSNPRKQLVLRLPLSLQVWMAARGAVWATGRFTAVQRS